MTSAVDEIHGSEFEVLVARAAAGRRPVSPALVAELEKAVGSEHVLTGEPALTVYSRDSWPVAALRVHHGRSQIGRASCRERV